MSSNVKIIILQKNLELLLIHRSSRDIEDFMISPEKNPQGVKTSFGRTANKKSQPFILFSIG